MTTLASATSATPTMARVSPMGAIHWRTPMRLDRR